MTTDNKQTVVGLGELLWDCFPDGRRPGGAPANVAFHAGQLGFHAVVCSRVGNDTLGDELLQFLAEQGLATDHVQRDPACPTGTVTVDATDPESPRYTIHEQVAWDHIAWDDSIAALAEQSAAVCFGTLAQRHAVSHATIEKMLRTVGDDCLVVYDVNLRQHYYNRAIIQRSLALADAVKLNAEEVATLAPLLELPAAPIAFGRQLCQRYGVTTVCITRGAAGCLLVTEDEAADSRATPVAVVDAVGAGDAFTAAWIAAQLWGLPLEPQATFANRVGGLVASRAGAMPRLAEELTQLTAHLRAN